MNKGTAASLIVVLTCVWGASLFLRKLAEDGQAAHVARMRSVSTAPFHKVKLKALSSFVLKSGNPRASDSAYSGFLTADQLPDGTFVSLKDGGRLCVHCPGKTDQTLHGDFGRFDWQISLSLTSPTEAILACPEDGIAWSVNLNDGKQSKLMQEPKLQKVVRTKSGMLAGLSDNFLYLADQKGRVFWRQALKRSNEEWIPPAPVAAIGSTADGEFTALFAQPPTAISYGKSGNVVKQIRLQQDDYLSGIAVISNSGFWNSYGDTVQHFGLDGKKISESHARTSTGEALIGGGDSFQYFNVDDKGAYRLSDGYAVYRFDDRGNLLQTLGQGPDVDTIYEPSTFATLPDNRMVVLDERTKRLHLCAEDGKRIGLFTDVLAKQPGGFDWTIAVGAQSRVFAQGGVNETSNQTVIAFDDHGKELNRTTFPPSIAMGDFFVDGPPDTRVHFRDTLGNQGAILKDAEGDEIKDVTNYDLCSSGTLAVYGYRAIYLMDESGKCVAEIPGGNDQDPVSNVAFNGSIALVLKQDLGLTAYNSDGVELWQAPRKIGDDLPLWTHVELSGDGSKFAMLDSDGQITWYAMPE